MYFRSLVYDDMLLAVIAQLFGYVPFIFGRICSDYGVIRYSHGMVRVTALPYYRSWLTPEQRECPLLPSTGLRLRAFLDPPYGLVLIGPPMGQVHRFPVGHTMYVVAQDLSRISLHIFG